MSEKELETRVVSTPAVLEELSALGTLVQSARASSQIAIDCKALNHTSAPIQHGRQFCPSASVSSSIACGCPVNKVFLKGSIKSYQLL